MLNYCPRVWESYTTLSIVDTSIHDRLLDKIKVFLNTNEEITPSFVLAIHSAVNFIEIKTGICILNKKFLLTFLLKKMLGKRASLPAFKLSLSPIIQVRYKESHGDSKYNSQDVNKICDLLNNNLAICLQDLLLFTDAASVVFEIVVGFQDTKDIPDTLQHAFLILFKHFLLQQGSASTGVGYNRKVPDNALKILKTFTPIKL